MAAFAALRRAVAGRGRRINAMVSLVDVLPTVLEAAGVAVPATMQGRSFRGLLEATPGARHRSLLFAEHNSHGPSVAAFYPSRSVRGERFKYIRNLLPEKTYRLPADLCTRERWGNTCYDAVAGCRDTFPVQHALLQKVFKRPAEELYDLAADPHEMRNLLDRPEAQLAALQRTALARLRSALDEWMRATGDPGPKTM